MMTKKFIAGLDIGNGYVKGTVSEFNPSGTRITLPELISIDIPSGIAYVTNSHDMKTRDADVPAEIDDIFNQMDISFDSALVKDKHRHLFGERGITSGNMIEEFDVFSSISKAKQPLSFMLTLGCIAGSVLKNWFNEKKSLPKDIIHSEIDIALALPITEFKKYRKEYADSYKKCIHRVQFHNFEQPVFVEMKFNDVQIIAEGASAQYAIKARGVEFMNAMMNDIRRMGEPLEGITAKDVLAANNVIGIDIGEGTVNFPVYQSTAAGGSKFNPDVSMSYAKGYGAVLNQALSRLQDMGIQIQSRKQLQAFLNTPPSPMRRAMYRQIQSIVDEEITGFVTEIGMQFSKILSRVGTFTEVVYVYGGGASPVRDELYPLLIQKSKAAGGDELLCPILYLDSRYSRFLNREGLYQMMLMFAQSSAA